MPRHTRLFLPNAIYHVYCRVARGEFVFDDDFEAMEFVVLALPRYGIRGCDIAALLVKHGNSVSLWLRKGLQLEHEDPEFKELLHELDAAISRVQTIQQL